MKSCLSETSNNGSLALNRDNASVDIFALLLWMINLVYFISN